MGWLHLGFEWFLSLSIEKVDCKFFDGFQDMKPVYIFLKLVFKKNVLDNNKKCHETAFFDADILTKNFVCPELCFL